MRQQALWKTLILRSDPQGAHLEGWPQPSWFETALKKRLLTMRVNLL
jgi:hypothetical protein